MLEIINISKQYKQTLVLDQCSLCAKPFQIIGILGLNGCGKTTLFKIIMGLIPASSGEVLLDKQALDTHLVGYMPEQRSLYLDLRVFDYAMFIGHLKGLTDDFIYSQLSNLLNLMKIEHYMYTKIRILSKGNQQRVQFVCACLHNPSILILDEPFNGLDYHSQIDFMKMLKEWAKQGKTILISSHQLNLMDDLCDEVLILKEGKTILSGSISMIRNNHQHYRVSVNSDSRWKEMDIPYIAINALIERVQFEFNTLKHAKKAVQYFNKDNSVYRLELSMVPLSELVKV
jgi:ABC-2 type transport system ATP-binding protein